MDSPTLGVTQSPFYGIIDVSDENKLQKTNLEYIDEEQLDEFRVHSSNTRSANRKRNMVISDDEGSDEDNDSVDASESNLQKTNLEYIDEEHTGEFRVHSSTTRSTKRKWASNTVTSDDEDSYGDNDPICTVLTQHSSRVATDSEEELKENVCNDSIEIVVPGEDEEDINDGVHESQSEDEEDLDEFIVDSPESVSENEFIDFNAILEKISRKKNHNMGWDLEGDMLSDFAKDPALCMSAVCALYRQQTADEKESKETRHRNKRGFSQADAWRGSQLAKFLMDGDSNGDVKKTVKELEEHDSEGNEQCRKFANKYSKQLFTIYKNKEDPYFRPLR